MILLRIMLVLAFCNGHWARIPAVRVRLQAMTAATSQVEFGANLPEGRWARALSFWVSVDLLDPGVKH